MMIDREYLWSLGSEFAHEMRTLSLDIASYIPVDRLDEFIGSEVKAESDQDEKREKHSPWLARDGRRNDPAHSLACPDEREVSRRGSTFSSARLSCRRTARRASA